jgi:EpsI family protein
VLPVLAILVFGGVSVHWLALRSEIEVPRTQLKQMPSVLGEWRQKGSEFRFEVPVESLLGATDYTMREYQLPAGRPANLYVGYYASQRSGATYHSPLNCLPGAGWVMKDGQRITITTSDGRGFEANRYIIENGIYRELMIYWFQGRGRITSSEYRDKLNTVTDSIALGRSDGAMVRVMTPVGQDEAAAEQAAADLAAQLEEALPPYVPN